MRQSESYIFPIHLATLTALAPHLKEIKRFTLVSFTLSLLLSHIACDTGFGQPCELPRSEALQQACTPPPTSDEEDRNNSTEQQFKATCAIDNYPTCETLSCLVYRGSSPYCSMRCSTDQDCDGQGACCPLFGECGSSVTPTQAPQNMMSDAEAPIMSAAPVAPAPAAACGDGLSPCYCIRRVDLDR